MVYGTPDALRSRHAGPRSRLRSGCTGRCHVIQPRSRHTGPRSRPTVPFRPEAPRGAEKGQRLAGGFQYNTSFKYLERRPLWFPQSALAAKSKERGKVPGTNCTEIVAVSKGCWISTRERD
eukprot:3801503-Rhodomonas_salina.1